ncbi:S8 family serine peptidase [Pedobacter cryoconitis]|uniref:Subtilisin family serine protease n=1 Tax=Pedobacter cryoconitis TaxID=188932 RepID=A0A7X0MKX3_9SPHI|nr:S8 family serine peptidase [Pedobacter cryoconitis]MBB6502516.1 subtilisin family serine protease [Pedobacter cryoconitis]
MKKRTLLLVLSLQIVVLTGKAQLVQKKSKEKIADWYNLSFDKDGVYGAEVNKAYEFLKGKQIKKKPIVAVIGYGMDGEHEDLKDSQWTNPNEKADGVDHDKDGWIGDIHGWNFLGNAQGEMIEKTNKEGDREYFRLRGLYEGIFFNGTDYVKFDDILQKPVIVPAPANIAEYKYFRYALQKESQLATEAISYNVLKFEKYYLNNDFESDIKKMYPDLSKVGQHEFTKATNYLDHQGSHVDSLKLMSRYFFLFAMGVNNGSMTKLKRDSVTYIAMRDLVLKNNRPKNTYESLLANMVDARKITGDDFTNISQKNYGNNNLYSNGSFSGTMISGIIAANRANNIGIKGIMPDAQLMSLRVYPKVGEAYYKDIALAIRYAVEHKADVIMLGPSNTVYPAYEAKWVNDALLYAEQKGILVVSSVWDLSRDLSKQSFYPNQYINGKELNNFIQVAASDSLGMPLKSANFGAKEVNLFAPGVNVSTTYMGSTYRQGVSSLFAGACVAGTAALIKAYYPQLNAVQIRALILNNVTDRKDVEVEKQVGMKTDQYLFKQLCSTGGILNTYKSVLAADKLSKTK